MNVGSQLPLDFPYQVDFNLENLIITQSNEAAYKLIETWPIWPNHIAMIVGPKGSGKTHFSTIWKNQANAQLIEDCDLKQAILEASKGYSILLENIDDFLLNETELFHLFNTIKEMQSFNPNISLLMTSKTSPMAWDLSLKDLISRIRLVTYAFLQQPDDKLLEAVLVKLFSDKQIFIKQDIIQYIVMRMERSLLMANILVNEADKLALSEKRKITKALMNQIFSSLEDKKNVD